MRPVPFFRDSKGTPRGNVGTRFFPVGCHVLLREDFCFATGRFQSSLIKLHLGIQSKVLINEVSLESQSNYGHSKEVLIITQRPSRVCLYNLRKPRTHSSVCRFVKRAPLGGQASDSTRGLVPVLGGVAYSPFFLSPTVSSYPSRVFQAFK